jgi:hypothetical protein
MMGRLSSSRTFSITACRSPAYATLESVRSRVRLRRQRTSLRDITDLLSGFVGFGQARWITWKFNKNANPGAVSPQGARTRFERKLG